MPVLRSQSRVVIEQERHFLRVFVSEFLCGGASAGLSADPSMRREGLAMLRAITEDLARMPGYSVVTTFESGYPFVLDGEVIPVRDQSEEAAVFQRLLSQVDAVLVIAPETDGVLANRCRHVRSASVASWNCSPDAIELCGDKLRMAEHLTLSGLPTIPTKLADLSQSKHDIIEPIVLKPRDGAGSHLTFYVSSATEWDIAARSFHEIGASKNCLVQSYIEGRTLSIGVNISLDGTRIECLPVGEQRLSNDGRFRYLGGTIPAIISPFRQAGIKDLVLKICRTIPGLAGYIGIDLILTTDGEPLIVEINPRLTTAYVGYRQLYRESLPSRWLPMTEPTPEPILGNCSIQFTVEGISES